MMDPVFEVSISRPVNEVERRVFFSSSFSLSLSTKDDSRRQKKVLQS